MRLCGSGSKAQKKQDDEDDEVMSAKKNAKKSSGPLAQYKVLSKLNLFSRLCSVWEFLGQLVLKTSLSVSAWFHSHASN